MKRKCSRGRKSEQKAVENRDRDFVLCRLFAYMNVLLPLLGTLLVVVAVSFSCCCCVCSCCCCVSSSCCCCCCCVFSVCFSYTFAAALRKGSGKVGSLPFCCCCCRCCLRATFTAAARHRYTHVYARTHTRVTKRNEVGVRTNTRAAHTRSHTHVVSNNFMHFSTEFIIMCIYENVCSVSVSACVCVRVFVCVSVCFDGIFMLAFVLFLFSFISSVCLPAKMHSQLTFLFSF